MNILKPFYISFCLKKIVFYEFSFGNFGMYHLMTLFFYNYNFMHIFLGFPALYSICRRKCSGFGKSYWDDHEPFEESWSSGIAGKHWRIPWFDWFSWTCYPSCKYYIQFKKILIELKIKIKSLYIYIYIYIYILYIYIYI